MMNEQFGYMFTPSTNLLEKKLIRDVCYKNLTISDRWTDQSVNQYYEEFHSYVEIALFDLPFDMFPFFPHGSQGPRLGRI